MSVRSSASRLVALLGDPVAHSLSPRFQNAAFEAAGVDGVYVGLRCGTEEFAGLLRGITRAGGAGNVTIPHKERAAALVEHRTEAVERTGACNTFWLEDGRIWGDNTDVAGFRAAVRGLVGSVRDSRVLVLGAGGAARAAVYALLGDEVDRIDVLNRTRARAEALREALDPGGRRLRVLDDAETLRQNRYDLVVNTTALGLHEDDPVPLALDRIGHVDAVFDVVYRPGGTAWVREARTRGIPAVDGLEMLLEQGAAAFERWWGRPAPRDAMREALARSATVDAAPATSHNA